VALRARRAFVLIRPCIGTAGRLILSVPSGSLIKVIAALAMVLLTAACHRGPKRAPVIGEAFAGPAVVKIRSDIPTQSAPVATVNHGERLEILQRRRTFFRVRTASGAEGWADERQLLAASDMANLKQLAALAAKLPPQGAAVPRYGDLRIYTQPSLESPSFVTVKEKDRVEVLTHAVMPRTAAQRAPLLPPAPKKAALKKKTKDSIYPAIPMPKPPAPPADWLALSKTESDDAREAADIAAAPPTPTDDWSLVRTADGQAGWTLTRRLTMAIPDEVAQYAEGRRIVSYFSLGTIRDGDTRKDIWLWTTVADGPHPYDFDSLRVFNWSLRHHRYETAYIERNLTGFQPVLLEQVDFAPPGKTALAGAPEKSPGFSVCIRKKDGQRYRHVFALLANVVRFAGERPCETPPSVQNLIASPSKPAPLVAAAPATEPPRQSMLERAKKRVRAWFGK
jgi:SH3-like domain-containing protein